MKFGEYLKELSYNTLYEYKNFEYLKQNEKQYKILGQGAFGDVYLSKNKLDSKLYAIKKMDKVKIIENGSRLEIVVREMNVHQRLIHDNIVRMHSQYEDRDSFYFIMDYIGNGTLYDVIRKEKGMEEKKAFYYFISVVAAVHFLHENNLVHRDLKPENLLIDDDNNIKLCDFGWCVELEGSRSTVCGTYEYMAPELVNEDPYGQSIDVWSLGILLYELLHGYSPFRAKNTSNKFNDNEYIEIFRNIIKYDFQIEKELSFACSDLIKKLLAPDTKSRIKVRDIFYHPWVTSFEKEYKENKIKKDERKI